MEHLGYEYLDLEEAEKVDHVGLWRSGGRLVMGFQDHEVGFCQCFQ